MRQIRRSRPVALAQLEPIAVGSVDRFGLQPVALESARASVESHPQSRIGLAPLPVGSHRSVREKRQKTQPFRAPHYDGHLTQLVLPPSSRIAIEASPPNRIVGDYARRRGTRHFREREERIADQAFSEQTRDRRRGFSGGSSSSPTRRLSPWRPRGRLRCGASATRRRIRKIDSAPPAAPANASCPSARRSRRTLKSQPRTASKNRSRTSSRHLLNLNSRRGSRRASRSSIARCVAAAAASWMKTTIAATKMGLAPPATSKPASPDSSMKTSMGLHRAAPGEIQMPRPRADASDGGAGRLTADGK